MPHSIPIDHVRPFGRLIFFAQIFIFLFIFASCANGIVVDGPVVRTAANQTIPSDTIANPITGPVLIDKTQPPTLGADVISAQAPPKVTPTPLPVQTAEEPESAPAPAPVGTVVYYEEQITLPTYPIEEYQTDAIDARYNWPYKRFDIERFRIEAPTPEPRTYRLVVLENAYLKLSIMPELGGRIWQVIHKPSGAPIFYQNAVVKPTHWGDGKQLGWLGLGGLEWGIPVVEHGYDWGVPWGFIPLQHSADLASVTVFTPNDGRLLTASITISLRAGAAGFEIEPTISNLANRTVAFSFWHNAMLAPGTGKRPSSSLRFILPGDKMTVHSTNDATMPAPGQPFSWPIYQKRDLSRLDNYAQYLGFFEAPAAHGPFTAVYDPKYDVGVVRSYPSEIAQGSKVFVLGWRDALASSNFTDDNSSYVELHGGLAPTFADQYELPALGQVTWRESWYPVAGIGMVSYANEFAAIRVKMNIDQMEVAIYPTRPITGKIVVLAGRLTDDENASGKSMDKDIPILATMPYTARPDLPFQGHVRPNIDAKMPPTIETITVQLRDNNGHPLLSYPVSVTKNNEPTCLHHQ